MIIYVLLNRCGVDLCELYKKTSVQKILYGESMKVLLSEKQIYQHGTLRKVCAWLSLNALQY